MLLEVLLGMASIWNLLAAAGLREKKNHKSAGKGRGSRRDVEPLSFRSLRRTATTMLHEAGVPAAVAQALIGHDSEAMHELYVSVGRDALQKATEALPEVQMCRRLTVTPLSSAYPNRSKTPLGASPARSRTHKVPAHIFRVDTFSGVSDQSKPASNNRN
jgi:hypothetical protein